MPFKENEFKALLVKNGLSVSDLANKMGLNKATIYRKIKNSGNFTINEIEKLKCIFGEKEIKKIFFY